MTRTDRHIPTYTFNDFNKDLGELYTTLKQENFKNDEIQQLFSPIVSKIPPDQIQKDRSFKLLYKTILIMSFLIIILYLLTYWDRFYWNLTALTRIFLIKILPYFDWRYLKNEACSLPKFFDYPDQKISTQNEDIFNCDLCESLNGFEQIKYDLDYNIEDLIHKSIDIDRPIIVNGGIAHWIKESPEDFVNQLTNEREFARSMPCKLSTNVHNLRKDDVDVSTLKKKTSYFDSFFMHFQNCELEAMKIFRKYTYRPKVLPDELSPVTYNWLLWNKNHNSTKFKKIELVEKYTVIGQIFGKSKLKLIPRKNCQKVCPILEGLLLKAQFLVLTSLWDVEYLPASSGENIAAILEIKG